ncbi:Protein involved in sister chromatid separation and/or segregation, partial [Globisporangium splendens]
MSSCILPPFNDCRIHREDREMETLHVLFKGKSYAFPLPSGAATTVAQVQELLAHELNVPPDAQRWFQKKKKIDTNAADRLFSDVCGDTQQAALYVMAGASTSQIQHMEKVHQSVDAEQRIRDNRRMVSISKLNQTATARDAVATDYRFHAIEVLPNFSDKDRAREILERLANDRGILAVMAKHKWTVGTLAEMYPDGKVGVDPVCVLGLNQNKGQKILLRLRTDDLLGFRKYLNIKKVLFHELTHNVYSEHDAKFFTLMSQVEKECAALDWTNAGGATVGSGSGFARIDDNDDDDKSARSTGHRLGGGTSTSRLLLSRQQQAVTKEESFRDVAALPDNGGVTVKPTPEPNDSTETSPVASTPDTPVTPACVPVSEDRQSHEETTRSQLSHDMDPTPAAPSASDSVTEVKSSSPRASAVDDTDVEMTDASNIVGSEISGYEPSEREQQIVGSVRALCQRHGRENVAKAVSLLDKILLNVMQHPTEPKFKSIRKSNKLFGAHVALFPEALEFLRAVGFEDRDDAYVLTREDAALLWVGRAALEPVLLITKAS